MSHEHARSAANKRPPRAPLGWAWPVIAGVAAIDLVSKVLAHLYLRPLDASPHHSWLQLGLVMNAGMSLGIEAEHPPLAVAFSALSIMFLASWLYRARTRVQVAALALALGGGLGNLIDRLAHGAVTDWIHLNPYAPTFNLADVAIRTGLVTALAAALIGTSTQHKQRRPIKPRSQP